MTKGDSCKSPMDPEMALKEGIMQTYQLNYQNTSED